MRNTDAYWHLMQACVALAAAVSKAAALGDEAQPVIDAIIHAGEHLDLMGDADELREALAA
jgi:hypothetical protein